MKAIFERLREQLTVGHDVMLVTVVKKAGSVPRGVGAQMLVTQEGRIAGTIGGGAGEWTMTHAAMELIKKRQSGMYTYVLRSEKEDAIGVCGGDITAQMQYIPANDPLWHALADALLARIAARRPGYLALDMDGGAPALLDENKRSVCGAFEAQGFLLPLAIGERAVIFGAGHCAQALVPVLASVGFRVTVYDDRAALADTALFPQAERVICAPYDDIAAHIELDEDDYVVVMSSMHAHDVVIQQQLLRREYAYNGMLGSEQKRAFVNAKLLESGVAQARIDTVHTPIGLAIKAVTPAEIALSIAGEMVLLRAKRRESIQSK